MYPFDFVCWRDGKWFLGYLTAFPNYWTQGRSLADLRDHLLDLHTDLTGGMIPGHPTS